MMPLSASRMLVSRLSPPRLAGGMSGSTCDRSPSVRSLGYRKRSRLYLARFSFVHIDGPPNQTAFHESQPIHETQQVSRQTLRDSDEASLSSTLKATT